MDLDEMPTFQVGNKLDIGLDVNWKSVNSLPDRSFNE